MRWAINIFNTSTWQDTVYLLYRHICLRFRWIIQEAHTEANERKPTMYGKKKYEFGHVNLSAVTLLLRQPNHTKKQTKGITEISTFLYKTCPCTANMTYSYSVNNNDNKSFNRQIM